MQELPDNLGELSLLLTTLIVRKLKKLEQSGPKFSSECDPTEELTLINNRVTKLEERYRGVLVGQEENKLALNSLKQNCQDLEKGQVCLQEKLEKIKKANGRRY